MHKRGQLKVLLIHRVWLFVIPYTVTHQAPLSMAFSRHEYWSEQLFPDPGIEPRSPTLQADSLPSEPPGKPKQGQLAHIYPSATVTVRCHWSKNNVSAFQIQHNLKESFNKYAVILLEFYHMPTTMPGVRNYGRDLPVVKQDLCNQIYESKESMVRWGKKCAQEIQRR